MPQRLRASKTWRNLNMPISYRLNEDRDRLSDALNVFTVQDRLETRFGYSRYNSTALGGSVLSISFFKTADNTRSRIAKVGSTLYKVSGSGAHTEITTTLSSSTKHRGKTWIRGETSRHIMALDTDGLYSYDGTNFSQLGQSVPSAPTVAKDEGSGTVTAGDWRVALTYYASTLGFETNIGTASTVATLDGGNDAIAVSAIPTTADNSYIDKIRVYVQDYTNNGDWLYWDELDLGTTTDSIDSDPTSSQTPPTTHQTPPQKAKYIVEFDRRLAVAGIYGEEGSVWISEEDLPDAFDDSGTSTNSPRLYPSGDGPITGLAVGAYKGDVGRIPYLVIFKQYSTSIYSTSGGLVKISDDEGCESHDTIIVRNGDVYFLSASGFKVISQGVLIKDNKGNSFDLGGGDISDIFRSSGYTHELNKANMSNFFSVYYRELDMVMNFVSEGALNNFFRTYNYEFELKGFRPYEFAINNITCAMRGEDSSGREEIYFADANGYLYTHSTREDRTDVDSSNDSSNIAAFAVLNWLFPGDMDASYNFGLLMLEALSNDNDITVKTWIDANVNTLQESDYSFPSPSSGFQLDVSRLDQDVISDARYVVRQTGEVFRTGYNILIGFYQTAENSSIGLLRMQLDMSKNGSRVSGG